MKVYTNPQDATTEHGGYIPTCDECGKGINGPLADMEGDSQYDLFFCLPCMKKTVEQMENLAQKKG